MVNKPLMVAIGLILLSSGFVFQEHVGQKASVWFSTLRALVDRSAPVPLSFQDVESAFCVAELDVVSGASTPSSNEAVVLKPVNVETVEGRVGNAFKFDGENSYVSSSLNFSEWSTVNVSLWVKPKLMMFSDNLSIIVDTGHNLVEGFVIQSADETGGGKWVLFSNNTSLLFDLEVEKWNLLELTVNKKSSELHVKVNGIFVNKAYVNGGISFGQSSLTFGKRTGFDQRYFYGDLDRIVISGS